MAKYLVFFGYTWVFLGIPGFFRAYLGFVPGIPENTRVFCHFAAAMAQEAGVSTAKVGVSTACGEHLLREVLVQVNTS